MSQPCFLLTSLERFQQLRGNGSSNMECPTAIGKTKLDGARSKAALFSPLVKAPSSPLVATSPMNWPWPPEKQVDHELTSLVRPLKSESHAQAPHVNGLFGGSATKPLTFLEIIQKLKKLS